MAESCGREERMVEVRVFHVVATGLTTWKKDIGSEFAGVGELFSSESSEKRPDSSIIMSERISTGVQSIRLSEGMSAGRHLRYAEVEMI
jgi:hypothetical protein